jgi:cyclohexanecarboxylate-CoA ligase
VCGMAGEKTDYRQAGHWRDETFLDDLARHVALRPDKIALLTRLADTGEVHKFTYAELDRLTRRCAGAIRSLGLKPGQTLAAQLENCWQIAPLGLACLRAGVKFCPLVPIYRRRELDIMLRLTEAPVFIGMSEYGGEDRGKIAAELAAELPTLERVLIVGDTRPDGCLDFNDYFFGKEWEKEDLPADIAHGPDDPFLILFTSGTTGEPKGVQHSQNTLHAAVRIETEVFGLDESLVLSSTSASTHYVGFVQGLLLPFHLGATAAYQNTAEPNAVLDFVAEHGVTFLYSSPTFLRPLLDTQLAHPRDVSSLRTLVSGSAPILPQFVEESLRAFNVRLHALFGMSENGPVTITRREDPPDWAARSDGHPTPGTEIRIEPMASQPDGGGVLWVRGPTQCLGYLHREELYARQLDADGWFCTGDVATPDGRGGVRISGRAKDIILRNAFTVPVTDIEALLAGHPQVREATLVGIPDGRGDETIVAVVSCHGEPITLDQVQKLLDDAGMSKLYWPTRLEIRDNLPKTAMGKVQKEVLRAGLR